MANTVTLQMLRDEAPTLVYAGAYQAIIEEHPVFEVLNWQGVSGDRFAYTRIRGASTAPGFDADGTISAGTDESFDPMIAYIRRCGGQIQRPIVASTFGSLSDRIRAKVIAVGKEMQDALYGGDSYSSGSILSCSSPALENLVMSPQMDINSRGGGGVFKLTHDGAGTYTIAYKDNRDVDFGDAYTTVADITTPVKFTGSNPNLWCYATVDVSDIGAGAGTSYGVVTVTPTTYRPDGLITLARGSDQAIEVDTAAGEYFDFGHLDIVRDTTKGTRIVCTMNPRTFRSMKAAARTLGGASITEAMSLATDQPMKNAVRYGDMLVVADEGVPITDTFGGTSNCGYIVAFDADNGVRGLYSTGGIENLNGELYGGLYIRSIGESETYDANITRVTGYYGFAHLNTQGLTVLRGIRD